MFGQGLYFLTNISIGCGNTVGGGNGPAPDGNAQCNMPCKGKATDMCGGPNRLTVYKLSSGGTNPPPVGTGKRGLPYNNNNPSRNAVYANLFKGHGKISWAYDWGYPSWGLDAFFELYVAVSTGNEPYL